MCEPSGRRRVKMRHKFLLVRRWIIKTKGRVLGGRAGSERLPGGKADTACLSVG